MKKTLLSLLFVSILSFGCSKEELEIKDAEIKSLKAELVQAKEDAEEQKKRADFAKEQAKTAQIRTEEILKDCEGKN